jgi:hypothetical protein
LEEGQWDERTGRLNWDAEGACCHATPTLAFSEGAKYHLWAFFTMCKIPEAVSVLGAIVLAVVVVSATTIVIGNEARRPPPERGATGGENGGGSERSPRNPRPTISCPALRSRRGGGRPPPRAAPPPPPPRPPRPLPGARCRPRGQPPCPMFG